MITNAYKYSLQQSVKEKIMVDMIPGRDNGKIILHSVPILVHPSIRAASSSSIGIDLKYEISIQVA